MLVSQKTRFVSQAEASFWEDKDAGVSVIPPIPCRDCGFVWDHDPNCASHWSGDPDSFKHGDIRHGKVWCIGCKEWIDENVTHARLVLREVADWKKEQEAIARNDEAMEHWKAERARENS